MRGQCVNIYCPNPACQNYVPPHYSSSMQPPNNVVYNQQVTRQTPVYPQGGPMSTGGGASMGVPPYPPQRTMGANMTSGGRMQGNSPYLQRMMTGGQQASNHMPMQHNQVINYF